MQKLNKIEVQQDWTPQGAKMSFFKAPVTNTRPSAIMTLADVFGLVTGTSYQERTGTLRTLLTKAERQQFKGEQFDYVCFSGTFSYHSDASLMEHSQLLCVDFDHIDDVQALRRQLLADPYFETQLMFTSPSGQGVKWVIHIDTTLRDHREWFRLLEAYFQKTYHQKIDPQCINVSRACYLGYDPEAYLNPALLNTREVQAADQEEVRAIAEQLVAQGKDITAGYDNWLRLGFALADGLGESGRELFHRLSQQNAGYNEAECDQQWRNCLNGKGDGITIRSFYKMASDAGIDLAAIARQFSSKSSFPQGEEKSGKYGLLRFLADFGENPQGEENEETEETANLDAFDEARFMSDFSCTFSDKINIAGLPSLLREMIETQTSTENRDMMLIGAITCLSGVTPGVFGVYDKRRVYPPFYQLVSAPAASDKGQLVYLRYLLRPIEQEIRAQNDREIEEAKALQTEEPPYRSLFIPGNSSATAAYEALAANEGWGVTIETEADIVTESMKSDYGNYSTGMRAAFHHEPISYNRRKEKEHVHINNPRWAIVISCTPGQIPLFLPTSENGLASRFLFYNLPRKLTWRNVFEDDNQPLDELFFQIGQRYLTLYHALRQLEADGKAIQIVLSDEQKRQFNEYFEQLQSEQVHLYGDDLIAFVRRLGLICFRIIMLLTILRCLDRSPMLDPLSQSLVCSDEDFETALEIIDCLVNHTGYVYDRLIPHHEKIGQGIGADMLADEKRLFEKLDGQFTRKDYLQSAKELSITEKTAERYVENYIKKYHVVIRMRQGHYEKVA